MFQELFSPSVQHSLDLAGIFVFAISGALLAVRKNFDVFGIAVLAAFSSRRMADQSLADYLDTRVFEGVELVTVEPDEADAAGFDAFMERYVAGLAVQRAAVDALR